MTPMCKMLYRAISLSWGALSEQRQRYFMLQASNNRLENTLKRAKEEI